jgi:hypothetical protein
LKSGARCPKKIQTGSFIILTMGLFIEALKILAANNSLELEYELFQPPVGIYSRAHCAASGELAAVCPVDS